MKLTCAEAKLLYMYIPVIALINTYIRLMIYNNSRTNKALYNSNHKVVNELLTCNSNGLCKKLEKKKKKLERKKKN